MFSSSGKLVPGRSLRLAPSLTPVSHLCPQAYPLEDSAGAVKRPRALQIPDAKKRIGKGKSRNQRSWLMRLLEFPEQNGLRL